MGVITVVQYEHTVIHLFNTAAMDIQPDNLQISLKNAFLEYYHSFGESYYTRVITAAWHAAIPYSPLTFFEGKLLAVFSQRNINEKTNSTVEPPILLSSEFHEFHAKF